jgi:hypothetical protein
MKLVKHLATSYPCKEGCGRHMKYPLNLYLTLRFSSISSLMTPSILPCWSLIDLTTDMYSTSFIFSILVLAILSLNLNHNFSRAAIIRSEWR